MSNLDKAKISIEKISNCNSLIDCQNILQEILNDVGFYEHPKDLIENENYKLLIRYIDDLIKIVISAPSTKNINELTTLLQNTQTDIYIYLDNFVQDDTEYETIEEYIAGDFKDYQDFFLKKLIKSYLFYNLEEYILKIKL